MSFNKLPDYFPEPYDASKLTDKPTAARSRCLDEAKAAISARPLDYGAPEDNFRRIASLWNAYFDSRGYNVNIETWEVAALMSLLKIARLANSPSHADSWVDLAGYAACGAEITGK
jgi:hypothetical protein